MKRAGYRTLIPLLVLPFLVSACSSGTGSNSQTAASKKEPQKQVTLKFWKAAMDAPFHDYWVDAIKRYEAANPNVKIEYAEAPLGNEFDTKVNAAYASGDGPDLISAPIVSLALRADMGQYLPMDDVINKWSDKSDFIPSMLDMATYNGKSYGAPLSPIVELFTYRKDFAKEAGLDPEKPPVTWDEFANWADKMTIRKNGIVDRSGFVMPIDSGKRLLTYARQDGMKQVDDKGMPIMTSQGYVEALTFMTNLFKKNVTVEITENAERQQPPFLQGKAAMAVLLTDQLKKMISDDPSMKDKIGFINLKNKNESTFVGAHLMHINAESKHKEEAIQFFNFVFSKDEVWRRYKIAGAPPIRQSLFDDYKKDDPVINSAVIAALPSGEGNPKTTWSGLYVLKYIPQAMQEAFYGKKTPEKALQDNYDLLMKEIKK
jgi:ABC-type glycerol-3-phosphate transport system substrate-binding protein